MRCKSGKRSYYHLLYVINVLLESPKRDSAYVFLLDEVLADEKGG